MKKLPLSSVKRSEVSHVSVQCESRPEDACLDEILNTDDLKQHHTLLLGLSSSGNWTLEK